MTFARFFAAVLLLFPLAAFAQDQQGPLNFSSPAPFAVGAPTRSIPSEPWRITPKPHSFPKAQLSADVTCLTIRSYVVARDSKDSESTHLVSYSTCQPASRYRLKTAQSEGSTAELR